MAISEDYASPGLRWGLLLEDYPGSEANCHVAAGTTIGILPEAGGEDLFVICVITFPASSKREPAIGYKPFATHPTKKDGGLKHYDHESDRYKENCTKAKGRALVEAGYPADVVDLKALSIWRRQNRQLAALADGKATVALEAAKAEDAIVGTSEPEKVSRDDGDAPLARSDDESSDNEPAETNDGPPSDEATSSLKAAINALGDRSPELTKWARKQGYRVTRPHSEHEAQALISHARTLLGDQDAVVAEPEGAPADPVNTPPAEPVDEAPAGSNVETVRELLAGLDDSDRHAFEVFAKNVGVDPTADPGVWDGEALENILGWLAVG